MNRNPEMASVTIYLSSYNHARFLRESIESVLNQTFTDYELFIEDDASQDESWSIIESYRDARIKAFRNPVNRNDKEGMRRVFFEEGSGEYLAVHHSDNIWEATKLEKQVAFLDAHPEIGAVFTHAQIIDENGFPFENTADCYYSIFDQPNRNRYQWLNSFFHSGNALCHPSMLIRKNCFIDCGFHRSGFIQLPDYDMWVRLCLQHEIHVIQEKLVRFRVLSNEQNLSGNRIDSRLRIQYEILKVLENYQQLDTFEELERVFPEARNYYHAEGYVAEYVLAMLALDSPIFSKAQKELFALNLLFNALNDPIKKEKLGRLYGFKQIDFKRLTAKLDPFSLRDQLDLLEKSRALTLTSNELEEMKRSKAWLIVKVIRKFFHNFRRVPIFVKIIAAAESAFWKIKLREELSLIRSSGFFDTNWYLENNPDIAGSGMDPAVHFLLFGGREGRDPGPKFSSSYYLDRYDDVRSAGINPLVHYIRNGRAEKRERKIDQSFLEVLSHYNFQGSEFSPVEHAQREMLAPQMSDYFGRSKKIVQREGKLWVIKNGMNSDAIKRELLAYSLSKGLVNTCEIHTLTREDCRTLIDLNLSPVETLPENTLLIRVAQDCSRVELPLRTLDSALAGEFVFSLWIRRRDLGDFNHAYSKDGIRVFFDLNVSLNFESDLFDVDQFFNNTKYGFPGYWRVRERNGELLDILQIRRNYYEYRYQLIDTRKSFLEGIETIKDKIVSMDFIMQDYVKNAGYTGIEIEQMASFLEATHKRLPADVEKMVQVLFSEIPKNWEEQIINPSIN